MAVQQLGVADVRVAASVVKFVKEPCFDGP